MAAKKLELTPDKIIKRFDSLKDARELAGKSNSGFYLACHVLMLLGEQGEMQMRRLREKICFGHQCFDRVLDGLVSGGALSLRDEGNRRNRDLTFSGKHYILTEEGRETADYITERIESLPGYEEVFG